MVINIDCLISFGTLCANLEQVFFDIEKSDSLKLSYEKECPK